jgi:O-antigen/teichoic acid export membrane protein
MLIGKNLYKSLYWKVFQFGSSFFVNVIIARLLQASVAANFYSYLYIFSLCISLFTLGLDISLNYYLSRRQLSVSRAMRVTVLVTGLSLLISLPLLYLVYPPFRDGAVGSERLLLYGALYIAGGLLTTLSGAFFTAYGKNYLPARLATFVNLALIFVNLGLSRKYQGPQVAQPLFLFYFLFYFAQGIVLLTSALRLSYRAETAARNNVGLADLLKYSFLAFITNFTFFLAIRMCLYLLPYWASLSDQGNFIQAFKITEYLGLMTAALYYPLIAIVAEAEPGKMGDTILFLVRLSNTAVAFFSLVVLFFGNWLFPFVFGRSFDRMYGVFLCFIPGLFAACSSVFFTAWYFGSGHIRYNLVSACIQLVSVVVLFFLFTPLGGICGAALATSGAALLSMTYDSVIFRRFCVYRLPDLFFMGKKDWQMVGIFIRQWWN